MLGRGGRRGHAGVPCSTTCAADGFRVAGAAGVRGGPAGDRGAEAEPRGARHRAGGRQRARRARPGPARRRAGVEDRSRPAGDRAERPHGGRRPRAELRPRRGRSSEQAVPVPGAARAGPRGTAARGGSAAAGAAPGGGADRRPEHPRGAAGGKKVELAAKEFALLHALAEEPTRVYGKNELLRDVWGFQSLGRTRTLDAHACRLRKKLQSVAAAVGRERARRGLQADGGGVTEAAPTADPELVGRAEHELRGAAAALALACEAPAARSRRRASRPRVIDAQLDRLRAGLEDLATARGAEARGERARSRSSWAPSTRAAARPWATSFEWEGGPAPANLDRRRFAKALGNVLANAAKHGTGDVRVTGRAHNGGVRRSGAKPWPRPDDRLRGGRGAGRLAQLRDRRRHRRRDARPPGRVSAAPPARPAAALRRARERRPRGVSRCTTASARRRTRLGPEVQVLVAARDLQAGSRIERAVPSACGACPARFARPTHCRRPTR